MLPLRTSQTPRIGFIAADVCGMTGWVFVDVGHGHVVIDNDGEPVSSIMNIRSERCRVLSATPA